MRIHFTGVAGAGMSAAALMMREAGHRVSGSDEDVFPPMSTYVEGLGFPFHRRFDAANLPADLDMLVQGTSAKLGGEANPEVVEAQLAGRDVLAVLTVEGRTAGFAALVGSSSPLRRHWGTVLRVQVHPSRQGRGLGRTLMTGVHDIARSRGWEFVHLTARGGTGVDGFYRGLGYVEAGRLPGAIRLMPGDDRDEIILICRL